jgi:hypothetical protein
LRTDAITVASVSASDGKSGILLGFHSERSSKTSDVRYGGFDTQFWGEFAIFRPLGNSCLERIILLSGIIGTGTSLGGKMRGEGAGL